MHGNILYPLNVLKNVNPDIYEDAITKYKDRRQVMEQEIPNLNCLWNEAIHLSLVNPQQIKQALREAGLDIAMEFYKIDPRNFEPENTCTYIYDEMIGEPKKFIDYNPDLLEQFEKLPKEAKEYYREAIKRGKNPLLFHLVPHVLYKGVIDISKVNTIKV